MDTKAIIENALKRETESAREYKNTALLDAIASAGRFMFALDGDADHICKVAEDRVKAILYDYRNQRPMSAESSDSYIANVTIYEAIIRALLSAIAYHRAMA